MPALAAEAGLAGRNYFFSRPVQSCRCAAQDGSAVQRPWIASGVFEFPRRRFTSHCVFRFALFLISAECSQPVGQSWHL